MALNIYIYIYIAFSALARELNESSQACKQAELS
jgi:hypothetical protein